MSRNRSLAAIALLAFVGLTLRSEARGDLLYSFTDLGTLGGPDSNAYGVNASGQVAGASALPGGTTEHGVVFSNGHLTDVGTIATGLNSFALAINDNGQVAGWTNNNGGFGERAYIQTNGVKQDLGTLGGDGAQATAINNAGQAAGFSQIAGDTARHAFLYSNGTLTDIKTLGGTNSVAYGINASAQVIGTSQVSGDASYHAFSYVNGVIKDLGTLGGGRSEALGLNNAGTIVGDSTIAGGSATHAFAYINGAMQDLGTLGGLNSVAYSVNNSGQIVGYSMIALSGADSGLDLAGYHAMTVLNGTMVDLNTITALPTGWTLNIATGISDGNFIVGVASDPLGNYHSFLLQGNPNGQGAAPEPSSLALLGIGGVAIGLLSRWKSRGRALRRRGASA
jgi:probable HAF family extracellular repeat protein